MAADGGGVENFLKTTMSDVPRQFEFSRNDLLGKIALTDKIGNNDDIFALDAIKNLTQRRFFFPKSTTNLLKNPTLPDRVSMLMSRLGGVGVLGGAMADDDE